MPGFVARGRRKAAIQARARLVRVPRPLGAGSTVCVVSVFAVTVPWIHVPERARHRSGRKEVAGGEGCNGRADGRWYRENLSVVLLKIKETELCVRLEGGLECSLYS